MGEIARVLWEEERGREDDEGREAVRWRAPYLKCHWVDSALKDVGEMGSTGKMNKCYTALLPSTAGIPLNPGSVKGGGSSAVGLILTTGQVWD